MNSHDAICKLLISLASAVRDFSELPSPTQAQRDSFVIFVDDAITEAVETLEASTDEQALTVPNLWEP